MKFLHTRPGTVILSTLLAIGFIAAVGFALSGCAHQPPCSDCYIGVAKVLGTN